MVAKRRRLEMTVMVFIVLYDSRPGRASRVKVLCSAMIGKRSGAGPAYRICSYLEIEA